MNIMVITGLGVLLGSLLGLGFAYPTIKEIMRIQRTPADIISALPMGGQVEISGKIETEFQAIRSPLTQTECALWQAEVQEDHGRKGTQWVTIFKETSIHPFDVNDGTGKVRVFPADAELVLKYDVHENTGLFNSLNADIRAKVENLRVETSAQSGYERPLQIFESFVKSGETIFVLGEIRSTNGITTISPKEDAPLIISDRSERALLVMLYGRAILYTLASALVVGGLFLAGVIKAG